MKAHSLKDDVCTLARIFIILTPQIPHSTMEERPAAPQSQRRLGVRYVMPQRVIRA